MAYPDEDELLQLGARRGPTRSRVALLVVALLVAAGLVAWRVAASSSGHRSAAPTPSPSGPYFVPGPIVESLPASQMITVPTGSPAVEVDGNVFAVFGGALFTLRPDGSYLTDQTIDDAPYQLIADPARHRVWLVTLTPGDFDVRWVDSRHPGAQFGSNVPGLRLSEAALLGGTLYGLGTDGVVYRLTVQKNGAGFDSTPVRDASGLTADPQRDLLLITGLRGVDATVRALSPFDPKPAVTARLPFGKGEVVVVGAQIWAAGYGDHGAVLAQLDPGTLRVLRHSPVESQLGPGAQIAAVGKQVLFVRAGSGGDGLWCVDANTGAVLESWPDAAGAVATGPDGAYLLQSAGTGPQLITGGLCVG